MGKSLLLSELESSFVNRGNVAKLTGLSETLEDQACEVPGTE